MTLYCWPSFDLSTTEPSFAARCEYQEIPLSGSEGNQLIVFGSFLSDTPRCLLIHWEGHIILENTFEAGLREIIPLEDLEIEIRCVDFIWLDNILDSIGFDPADILGAIRDDRARGFPVCGESRDRRAG